MDNGHGFPGALPEIFSGWSAGQLGLTPGEGFWARIEQIAVKGEMTRGLDTAMQGHPSPRIWLFLHEPGRGELSAAVAMSFARELAFRDQAALLLDGDDREQALTRWSGRVESEGWIDLARYGTSVLTSGVPMPFVGRRGYFLGVGSFAPTDATGEEIDSLITRLRRQADDLLIVAPADSLGRLWAPAASIRVLCWDRQTMPVAEAEAVASDLEEAGCPLTALVSFQEAAAVEEKLVEEIFAEVDSTPDEAAEQEPEPTSDAGPAEVDEPEAGEEPISKPIPELEDEPGEDIPADDGASAAEDWRDLPLEREAASLESDAHDEGWHEPIPAPVPEPEGGSSRVFWIGAVAAVIVISAIAVYYFKFMKVPSEGHFEPIEIATGETNGTEGQDGAPAIVDASDPVEPAAGAADSLAAADSVAAGSVTREETAPPPAGEGVGGTTPDTSAPSSVSTEEGTGGQDAAAAAEDTPFEQTPAGFDMTPYQGPVGEAGWSLHVYSLSSTADTAKQVEELTRRGFTSEVRIIDLGEKGRWFRIYLGSFATRSVARAAMPALLEKLKVDWAKPERISTSAPE